MLGEVPKKHPPMGGLITVPMTMCSMSSCRPCPIFYDRHRRPDYFQLRAGHYVRRFRPGDVFYTPLYHLTPAGINDESALRALGLAVGPGGFGNTDSRSTPSRRSGRLGLVARPHCLKILSERASELGKDISSSESFVGAREGPCRPRCARCSSTRACPASELRHGRPLPIDYESEAPKA